MIHKTIETMASLKVNGRMQVQETTDIAGIQCGAIYSLICRGFGRLSILYEVTPVGTLRFLRK